MRAQEGHVQLGDHQVLVVARIADLGASIQILVGGRGLVARQVVQQGHRLGLGRQVGPRKARGRGDGVQCHGALVVARGRTGQHAVEVQARHAPVDHQHHLARRQRRYGPSFLRAPEGGLHLCRQGRQQRFGLGDVVIDELAEVRVGGRNGAVSVSGAIGFVHRCRQCGKLTRGLGGVWQSMVFVTRQPLEHRVERKDIGHGPAAQRGELLGLQDPGELDLAVGLHRLCGIERNLLNEAVNRIFHSALPAWGDGKRDSWMSLAVGLSLRYEGESPP
jgi:hypothetical protein